MNAPGIAPETISDRRITVTFFFDRLAAIRAEETVGMQSLADSIRRVSMPSKDMLPWLKLARFGDVMSGKRSLRHDKNVLAITGIEGDYDGEHIPFEEACSILRGHGIWALAYTSPSSSHERPRWRILCPFSEERPPGEREQYVARLNGLLGGVLAGESFGEVLRLLENRVGCTVA